MVEEVSSLLHASSWLPLDELYCAMDLPTLQIAWYKLTIIGC